MTIQQIQNLLQYLGYYTITVDSIWGPGSEQATRDFQKAEGLNIDGDPGKLTQAALVDAVAKGRFKPQDITQPENGTSAEDNIWADSKYFVRAEFACPCGRCGGFPVEPAPALVRVSNQIREHFGRPMIPSSGVRCQAHNDELPGSVPNSRHVSGRALDFSIPGVPVAYVLAYTRQLQTAGKLHYTYEMVGTGHVHIDVY